MKASSHRPSSRTRSSQFRRPIVDGLEDPGLFGRAFAVSHDPLIVTDREGEIQYANERASAVLELSRKKNKKSSLSQLFPSLPSASFQRMIGGKGPLEALFRGKNKNLEMVIDSKPLGKGLYLVALKQRDGMNGAESTAFQLKSASFLSQVIVSDSTDENGYYQSIIQHSPYGVGILFQDKLVIANPMFAKILGYRAADSTLGRSILEFIEPQSKRFFELLIRRKLKGESIPARFETKMLEANNSTIDVEASLTLGSYKGELALNLTISDVTLRKELERRLTDSERLFRNVVNSMVDALIITDLQGRVLDVNKEFERLTGFERNEALNATIPYPWVDEEGLKNSMTWLEGLRQNSEQRDFDITWAHKDGKRIAVSLNTTLLHNASGDPILMVNIARDITDRQTARAELGRQVRRLEVLYELSKMLGGTLDLREISRVTFQQLRKVIPTDAFYIDLYDDERQEVKWLYVVDIVDGQQAEIPLPQGAIALKEQSSSWKVITKRKPILDLRKSVPNKPLLMPFGDTGRASASLMHAPMFSKDRIIGIISVQSYELNAYTSDQLTLLESIANVAAIAIEKASLYQETVEKSRQIEARNKELDDFTYVVSHDLKEPLISVEGYAKILRQEFSSAFDASGQEYMQSIVESCSHMKRLIEDLLQLSRVSKLAEKRTRIDLRGLVDQVLEELQYTIRERQAEIEIQPDLPPVLGVDQHLRIVFRNLISNGIKFSDKTVPKISIRAVAHDMNVEITVADNGIGIEEEYFEKIFMIFQRLHKREEYEGTGAGLTIVRKIVEGHGGQIWVSSHKGKGTTFHFTLPSS